MGRSRASTTPGFHHSGFHHPGFHHPGFDADGWEIYRVVCDHLASFGHKVEYGSGRHACGRSLFVYVGDPSSGLQIKLCSGMAHIHDEARHVPPLWELSDRNSAAKGWGPGPPEGLLAMRTR